VIRKFAALVVVALSMAVVPLTSPANAVSYGPKLPTSVHIKVVQSANGKALKFRLSVSASDGTSPAGRIAYGISRAAGAARGAQVAARATSGSVNVSGSAVTVTGQVAHAGSYVIVARFSPSNSAKYLPSSNSLRTGIKAAGGQGNDNGAGGLPNTGGPDLGWLVAGFALAGAGAAAVAFSRRRLPALA
jgi:hypothetical protein